MNKIDLIFKDGAKESSTKIYFHERYRYTYDIVNSHLWVIDYDRSGFYSKLWLQSGYAATSSMFVFTKTTKDFRVNIYACSVCGCTITTYDNALLPSPIDWNSEFHEPGLLELGIGGTNPINCEQAVMKQALE